MRDKPKTDVVLRVLRAPKNGRVAPPFTSPRPVGEEVRGLSELSSARERLWSSLLCVVFAHQYQSETVRYSSNCTREDAATVVRAPREGVEVQKLHEQ